MKRVENYFPEESLTQIPASPCREKAKSKEGGITPECPRGCSPGKSGKYWKKSWKILEEEMKKEEGRDSVWGPMEGKPQQRGSGTHISNKDQPLSSAVSETAILSCIKTSTKG